MVRYIIVHFYVRYINLKKEWDGLTGTDIGVFPVHIKWKKWSGRKIGSLVWAYLWKNHYKKMENHYKK